MAPVLFNLFFAAMVDQWRRECSLLDSFGLEVNYVDMEKKRGVKGKLVKEKVAESVYQKERVTEMQFADDAAAVVKTREGLEQTAHILIRTAGKWGLKVSVEKTKFLVVGEHTEEEIAPIVVDGGEILAVDHFVYLGSEVTADERGVERDIRRRIGKAAGAFKSLKYAIYLNKSLSMRTKRLVFSATVWGTLFYGAESWAIKATQLQKIKSFHNRCMRVIAGVSNYDQRKKRITTEGVEKMVGNHTKEEMKVGRHMTVEEKIRRIRLRWLGHVARMGAERLPYKLLFGKLRGKRRSGGRKKRWKDVVVQQDFPFLGLTNDTWYELAMNREAWRKEASDFLGVESQREVEKLRCDRCGKAGIKGAIGMSTHIRFCLGMGMPGRVLTSCEKCGREGLKGAAGLTTHKRYCPARDGAPAVRRAGGGREMVGGRRPTLPRLTNDDPRFAFAGSKLMCNACEMTAKTAVGMRRHLRVCGRPTVAQRKMTIAERDALPSTHMCRTCGMKFKAAQHLKQHKRRTACGTARAVPVEN